MTEEPYEIDLTPEPWKATVEKSRFGWNVDFHSGFMGLRYPYWRPTQRMAEACARRGIARRNAENERRAERYEIG